MKRFKLMFLVIGIAIIFSGCSKDDSLAPLSQSDQETTLKKGKVVIEYSGVCTPNPSSFNEDAEAIGKQLLKGGVVTWYDNATDDPLVTGTTIWHVNTLPKKDGIEKFWGKAELLVGVDNPDNPDAVCLGKWDITWHGYITPIFDGDVQIGITAACDAVGIGKEGIVKGLVSKSYYEMNYIFGDFSTLAYYFNGSYH